MASWLPPCLSGQEEMEFLGSSILSIVYDYLSFIFQFSLLLILSLEVHKYEMLKLCSYRGI